MCYSPAYKEKVLSLNFGTKNFIITKHMWINFRKEFENKDNVFEDKNNKIYDDSDIKLKTPFTMNIIGPSTCGKTRLVSPTRE